LGISQEKNKTHYTSFSFLTCGYYFSIAESILC
jgi:hypothetical protein